MAQPKQSFRAEEDAEVFVKSICSTSGFRISGGSADFIGSIPTKLKGVLFDVEIPIDHGSSSWRQVAAALQKQLFTLTEDELKQGRYSPKWD